MIISSPPTRCNRLINHITISRSIILIAYNNPMSCGLSLFFSRFWIHFIHQNPLSLPKVSIMCFKLLWVHPRTISNFIMKNLLLNHLCMPWVPRRKTLFFSTAFPAKYPWLLFFIQIWVMTKVIMIKRSIISLVIVILVLISLNLLAVRLIIVA